MKKVLITGAGSYIGRSFEEYALVHHAGALSADTVDMIDGSWRSRDFSPYDCVFHVAGIAHADVGSVSEEDKKKYYAINTDLAIETCRKAKAEGVKQFVFMSSAIVYGDSAPYGKTKRITRETEPAPANFYGDSKWQADKGAERRYVHRDRAAPPDDLRQGLQGQLPGACRAGEKTARFPGCSERAVDAVYRKPLRVSLPGDDPG